MKSIPSKTLCATIMLFFFAALPLLAQNTGTVTGKVTERGKGVVGVNVFLQGTTLGSATNSEGVYEIRRVPPGNYVLVASFIGYKTRRADITVSAGATVTQNFTLEADVLDMEEVVVTGSRNPLAKIESSVAITTANEVKIRERAPRNTADLLTLVPGFYVESSGGEVGNNLWARGLPADGSYRYVTLMEEGMPVYDATELFFVNADIFVRVDENIERLEAVRGGNAALFGSNAPGGVVNFLSKTGGSTLAGTVKAGTGTDGLARYDFNVNGPLSDDWRFSVGGFYRYDDGVRDPGFPSSRGGQIKANFTRLLDKGYFKVYAKYIDDRNIFFLPVPVEQGERSGDEIKLKAETFADFPNDGTLTTAEGNLLRVPRPNTTGQFAGDFTIPLEDGQKQTGGSLIADFSFDLGDDWSLQNTARVMSVDHSWNAIVPFDIVSRQQYQQNVLANTPGGASVDFSYTNHAGPVTGQYALNAGLWHVSKPVSNFSNQLQIRKTINKHKITAGSYFGYYTADNFWYWQNVLLDVRSQPRFLDVAVRDAGGNVIRRVTDNGFTQYGSLYANGSGNVTLAAFFLGDEIDVTDRLRIDIGGRFEHNTFRQNTENSATFDLGGDSDADNNVAWGTGTFNRGTAKFDEWAISGGFNYSLSDRMSVYARGSRGYKMPILDNYLFAPNPDPELEAESLLQVEGGLKLGSPRFGLNAVAYWLQLQDFPSQDARVVNGQTIFFTSFVGKARTIGAEIEAIAEVAPGLRLNGILTLQDPKYTDFNENIGGVLVDHSDNRVRRVPQILADVTASYSNSGFFGNINWRFTGSRWANNSNTIELPAFSVLNAGAAYRFPAGFEIGVNVLNILDGAGLTEGNPRLDESGAPSGPSLARPILPRRLVGNLTYHF